MQWWSLQYVERLIPYFVLEWFEGEPGQTTPKTVQTTSQRAQVQARDFALDQV